MNLTIRFYGPLSDILGREVLCDAPETVTTIGALKAYLAAQYPNAAEILGSDRISSIVEDTIVPNDQPLTEADVVEFFPPVSGG